MFGLFNKNYKNDVISMAQDYMSRRDGNRQLGSHPNNVKEVRELNQSLNDDFNTMAYKIKAGGIITKAEHDIALTKYKRLLEIAIF